jgi:mRNA interferase MazF
MTFERYDVVVVPFPFTDRASTIRRPALVLSEEAPFGRETGQSLLAMITRAARSAWPFDVPITDLEPAGLSQGGVIRMKLFTLDQSLVLRRLGMLSARDKTAVQGALSAHLGMDMEPNDPR